MPSPPPSRRTAHQGQQGRFGRCRRQPEIWRQGLKAHGFAHVEQQLAPKSSGREKMATRPAWATRFDGGQETGQLRKLGRTVARPRPAARIGAGSRQAAPRIEETTEREVPHRSGCAGWMEAERAAFTCTLASATPVMTGQAEGARGRSCRHRQAPQGHRDRARPAHAGRESPGAWPHRIAHRRPSPLTTLPARRVLIPCRALACSRLQYPSAKVVVLRPPARKRPRASAASRVSAPDLPMSAANRRLTLAAARSQPGPGRTGDQPGRNPAGCDPPEPLVLRSK